MEHVVQRALVEGRGLQGGALPDRAAGSRTSLVFGVCYRYVHVCWRVAQNTVATCLCFVADPLCSWVEGRRRRRSITAKRYLSSLPSSAAMSKEDFVNELSSRTFKTSVFGDVQPAEYTDDTTDAEVE